MKEKNYQKLDALYVKYSRPTAKTADGISPLSPFFSGIAQSFNVLCINAKHSDEEWLAHQASLSAWRDAFPKSVGAKLALALFATEYAWYARGSGYSSTVSDASLALFKQRMASAKQQFDEMAGPGKNNPAWYEGMLTVGLAQGWAPARFNALYAKASKLDPYYLDIHYANTAYHAAKWYGSDQEERAAINRAVQLTKAQLGQAMYTRLYWTIGRSPAMFKAGGADWTRMKTGFEDFLRLAPSAFTRNNYAKYACMAGDKPTLRQQLALLGSDLDPKKWDDDYHYAYCTAYAKLSGLDDKPQCFTRASSGAYYCE